MLCGSGGARWCEDPKVGLDWTSEACGIWAVVLSKQHGEALGECFMVFVVFAVGNEYVSERRAYSRYV